MAFPRTSGLLLHPTSLPGPWGIGDLGPAAHAFVDFLEGAGQGLWQVLPLGPTGYGDSPYQCFSAFAGNPLLISPQLLADQDLLCAADLEGPAFPPDAVDYGPVITFKLGLLEKAHAAFEARAPAGRRTQLEGFCAEHAGWLHDYALFRTLKDAHGGRAWTSWDPPLRDREPAALAAWAKQQARAIEAHQLWQFLFFEQWDALRARAHERGIRIMGDIPIFVAQDSADVWAHPELFRLRRDGQPEVVAGVPPDYFSATGQLWGNPLYRWDAMEADGFQWWIRRFRATLRLFDWIRLDHFRGFEAFWEVPGGDQTAANGRWVKAPGSALFDALLQAIPDLPIVAENLGVITPEVEAIRARFGFPGMAILQFAFGTDPQAPTFIPHAYPRNLVVYTGTHDNDTTVGWWTSGVGDSTRTTEDVQAERDFAARYLDIEGREIHWALIRAVLASVADVAIVPLPDVLGLGSDARMNVPGRASGNWRWRMTDRALTAEIRTRLRTLAETYDRIPGKGGRA